MNTNTTARVSDDEKKGSSQTRETSDIAETPNSCQAQTRPNDGRVWAEYLFGVRTAVRVTRDDS